MSTQSLSASPSDFASRFISFDDYVVLARKRPFFLAILPTAFAVGTWFQSLHWWVSVPAVVSCLLVGVCGELGRIGGKALEEKLYARWGGKPTTRMLRHRDSPFDEQKLRLLHEKLGALTGVKALTKAQEQKRPDEADKIYEGYSTYLRNTTRDGKQFSLLRSELISYGFARNSLGLRPLGIGLSLFAILAVLARFAWLWHKQVAFAIYGVPLVIACFALFLLAFWTYWVRESWVRQMANAYAERLLEAAITLPIKDDS